MVIWGFELIKPKFTSIDSLKLDLSKKVILHYLWSVPLLTSYKLNSKFTDLVR